MTNKNILIALAVLVLSTTPSHCQTQNSFNELKKLLSLKYSNNSSLEEETNSTQIECNYSIADKNKGVEILYRLIPSENYKNNLLDRIYRSVALQSLIEFAKVTSSDLSSNESLIKEFDSFNVEQEFNADWGGTSSFVFTTSNLGNYKFCIILFLYKKNRGLVTTYFLFNDEKKGLEEVKNNFHNLIFI